MKSFKNSDCGLIRRITSDLGINLNEKKFQYQGRKGNASIFLGSGSLNLQKICDELNIERENTL